MFTTLASDYKCELRHEFLSFAELLMLPIKPCILEGTDRHGKEGCSPGAVPNILLVVLKLMKNCFFIVK
jgi:hypothetical protein